MPIHSHREAHRPEPVDRATLRRWFNTRRRSPALAVALALLLGSACQRSAPPAPRPVFWDAAGRRIDASEIASLFTEEVNVLLFSRSDCPITNRYAPTLRALHESFAPRGVQFYLVYPDHDASDAAIHQHLAEFALPGTYLRDPGHALVDFCGATITPEAAVYTRGGKRLYLGRIDDRFVSFGKERLQASAHDLEEAIAAALAGEPVTTSKTQAVGCRIPPAES